MLKYFKTDLQRLFNPVHHGGVAPGASFCGETY